MLAGDTALTRMPRDAYSIASDLVAEASPPLVSAGKNRWLRRVRNVGDGGRDVDDVAAAVLQHLGYGAPSQPEEPREVDRDHEGVVVGGVVGERLGNEYAGVVDKGVD